MSNLTIIVLGSGCTKCKKLYELTQTVVNEIGLDTEVEYSTDVEKIIELGALSSPVIAVNGTIVAEGSVPSRQDLKELLSGYAQRSMGEQKCCGNEDDCAVRCAPGSRTEDDCCCGSC